MKKTKKKTSRNRRSHKKQKQKQKKKKRQLTFHCNRSNILSDILKEHGFIQIDCSLPSDFSMWDTYKTFDIQSKLCCIGRKIMNSLDNKRQMYLTLESLGQTSFLPHTFPYASEISEMDLDPNKLYFLKMIHGSSGKNVYPVKTIRDIRKNVPGSLDNYIIQEEVPNMMLHDGCKSTMRMYGCVTIFVNT